jgi:hypothetical protein
MRSELRDRYQTLPHQVREEDMARLSPFVSSHLNLYLDMLRIRYVALVWAATRIGSSANSVVTLGEG